MSEFDFLKMGATGRQLQEIILSRLAERDAELTARETEAIMLLCVELAGIAHGSSLRASQWSGIAYLAAKMIEGER